MLKNSKVNDFFKLKIITYSHGSNAYIEYGNEQIALLGDLTY